MATNAPTKSAASQPLPGATFDVGGTLMGILRPLASLRLTVVLFALSIFIVLAGTLAQTKADIWEVINEYFRIDTHRLITPDAPWIHFEEFFVMIPLDIFAPESFFPGLKEIPGSFPFPKGWLIGLLMAFNLLAAHTVRFKTQAKGSRLALGWGAIAFGAIVTYAVIMSGSNRDGVQNEYSISWETVWHIIQGGSAALWLGLVYLLAAKKLGGKVSTRMGAGGAVLLLPLVGYLLWTGSNVPIDPSGMRILWQLIKGTAAGLVLLVGCVMVFNKRSGIVLLHGGIGLMMFYEVLVGVHAEEGQMQIPEGQTVNFTRDIREPELALLTNNDDGTDDVTAIPYDVLRDHLPVYEKRTDKNGDETTVRKRAGTSIHDERLPFDIRIEDYYPNCVRTRPTTEGAARVTSGVGKRYALKSVPKSTGASSSSASDRPGAYVTLLEKGTAEDYAKEREGKQVDREEIGRLMLYTGLDLELLTPSDYDDCYQPVEFGGKTWRISLRYARDYKPYAVTLEDVRAKTYEGTDIPSDYTSDVRLVQKSTDTNIEDTIWMNNPLRFGGETFYQSGYVKIPKGTPGLPAGTEITTLQVVTNTGWMVPYVSCMIVAVGMLAQFLITLTRFLRRKNAAVLQEDAFVDEGATGDKPARAKQAAPETALARRKQRQQIYVALIVLATAGWIGSKFVPRHAAEDDYDLQAFGLIPVRDDGRLKPIDSLARNTLRYFSGRTEFTDANENKQPAVRFLIDLITPIEDERIREKLVGKDAPPIPLTLAASHRVFRLTNQEAQKFLELADRGRYVNEHFANLYSFAELLPKWQKLQRQLAEVQSESQDGHPPSKRDLKLGELNSKLNRYYSLNVSFDPRWLDNVVGEEMRRLQMSVDPADRQTLIDLRANPTPEKLLAFLDQLFKNRKATLLIPVEQDGRQGKRSDRWKPYPLMAFQKEIPDANVEQPEFQLTETFGEIINAYQKRDPEAFNEDVAAYLGEIAADKPASLNLTRISYEHYFNGTEIYYYAAAASVIAFVLGCFSWLGNLDWLRRSAFWIIVLLLAVHTFGLASRIYISGRPPVTNLYSSAIFIGWGAVALGLLLEWLYPIGIAVVISSACSFITLLIAHLLSIGGDTIGVLQAVLDTQFWLATHVVCITLGYATTFMAGFLGLAYVIRGMCTPTLTPVMAKDVIRMIYGILCFSIFFSFVGTVLGGLWADDSWGRFWGWDPKENGALIIVLWNALVLHARWGGLVRDRGLALLAIAGNIATSWSWFGVNELGVGLHSYGFTDGVLMALGLSCLLHLGIIVAAAVWPQQDWWSFRRHRLLEASR